VVLALGPGDVPLKSEDIRVASRAAGTCGGWGALRGALDAIDWTAPEGRRALRAAVGTRNARALQSARAWNQLRPKAPRLPLAEDIGIGAAASEDGGANKRRRRRRRKMSTSEVANAAPEATPSAEGPEANGGQEAAAPSAGATASADGATPRKRRRRRRRRPAGAGAAGDGDSPPESSAAPPAE
jgi:hypothetical protein